MKIETVKKAKILLLTLSLGIIVGSCEDEQIFNPDDASKNQELVEMNPDYETENISGEEVPDILDELYSITGTSKTPYSFGKINYKNIDIYTNKVKRVKTRGKGSNYTFDIEVEGAPDNHLYNLIVHKKNKHIISMSVIQFEIEPETLKSFLTSEDELSMLNAKFKTYSFNSFMQDTKNNKIGKNGNCGGGGTGGSGGGHVTAPGESFILQSNGLTVTTAFGSGGLVPYNYTITLDNNGTVGSASTTASSTLADIFGYNGSLNQVYNAPTGITSVNINVAYGSPCMGSFERVTAGDGTQVYQYVPCGGNQQKAPDQPSTEIVLLPKVV